MPSTWLGRDSNGILRDFSADEIDESSMPAEVQGANENPFPEPFVIQSNVSDEAVLHVETTNTAQTANLFETQSTDGVLFSVGPRGDVQILKKGDADATPVVLINPQSMNEDPDADLLQVKNNFGVNAAGVTKNGYFYVADLPEGAGGPTEGVPDNAELEAGQCIIWFDKTNGSAKLMVKAKSANGTVVTGSVSLT
jgi:hypothetical protein